MLAGIVILIIAVVVILYRNEMKSLSSLRKLDDYGMFQMTYYGDYGFDDFLKSGAKSDSDIEAFVTKRLLKGLPFDLGITGAGCTAFVVRNEKGEVLYGRNFDFPYAPSLQLFTNPHNGYASVSTVNLSFAGYDEDNLPSGLNFDSFFALAAPYLPFDGMNEKGVAMALLAVPNAKGPNNPDHVTLNTTTAIRLVLDKAANVQEAVDLLRNYNIYFSGHIDCHYLIADATGKSVIVEYYDGEIQVVETDKDYQIASNFIAYQGLNIGEGGTEFDRYNRAEEVIREHGNVLTSDQAVGLLAEIGVRSGETDRLQWSVVYNLNTGETRLFPHRNRDKVFETLLKMQ